MKPISFSRLWEECTQEEARLITREVKMGETEDQDLTVHTRRYHKKKEDHHHNKREDHHHKRKNKFKIYPSNIRFYTCDEKGHYSIYYPKNIGSFNKKSNKKRNQAHSREDDEPTTKNSKKKDLIPQVMRNMYFNLEGFNP